MPAIQINAQSHYSDSPPDTPLLWVIREELRLTGTRFGCGAGLCGACTVHLDGQAVRSCQVKLGEVGKQHVTTIEGLDSAHAHPVQRAWIDLQVPQCGYCQSGQIMQAAALLAHNPSPSDKEIVEGMNGNLCRCATYPRIVAAVRRAAQMMKEPSHG